MRRENPSVQSFKREMAKARKSGLDNFALAQDDICKFFAHRIIMSDRGAFTGNHDDGDHVKVEVGATGKGGPSLTTQAEAAIDKSIGSNGYTEIKNLIHQHEQENHHTKTISKSMCSNHGDSSDPVNHNTHVSEDSKENKEKTIEYHPQVTLVGIDRQGSHTTMTHPAEDADKSAQSSDQGKSPRQNRTTQHHHVYEEPMCVRSKIYIVLDYQEAGQLAPDSLAKILGTVGKYSTVVIANADFVSKQLSMDQTQGRSTVQKGVGKKEVSFQLDHNVETLTGGGAEKHDSAQGSVGSVEAEWYHLDTDSEKSHNNNKGLQGAKSESYKRELKDLRKRQQGKSKALQSIQSESTCKLEDQDDGQCMWYFGNNGKGPHGHQEISYTQEMGLVGVLANHDSETSHVEETKMSCKKSGSSSGSDVGNDATPGIELQNRDEI